MNYLKRRPVVQQDSSEQVKAAETLEPKGRRSGVRTQAISTADDAPSAYEVAPNPRR